MFACVPCLLQFQDRDELQTHMKSELHTYNLKRRQAQQLPVLPAVFEMKKQLLAETMGNVDSAVNTVRAQGPRKTMIGAGFSRDNGEKSKKHLRNERALARRLQQSKNDRERQRQKAEAIEARISNCTCAHDTNDCDYFMWLADKEEDYRLHGECDGLEYLMSEDPLAEPDFNPVCPAAAQCGCCSCPLSAAEIGAAVLEKYTPFVCPFSRDHHFESGEELFQHILDDHTHCYIHDMKYLVDTAHFAVLMGKRVYEQRRCLLCSRGFKTADGCIEHMKQTAHQRIDPSTDMYLGCYDYTDSWKELKMSEEIRAKFEIIMQELSCYDSGEKEVNALEDLETVLGAEHVADDVPESQALSLCQQYDIHPTDDITTRLAKVGYKRGVIVGEGDHAELHLPSGAIVYGKRNTTSAADLNREEVDAKIAKYNAYLDEPGLRKDIRDAMRKQNQSQRSKAERLVLMLTEDGEESLKEQRQLIKRTIRQGMEYQRAGDLRMGKRNNMLNRHIMRQNMVFI